MLERGPRLFRESGGAPISLPEPRLLLGSGVALVSLLACVSLSPVATSPVSPLLHLGCHDDVTYIHSLAGSCEGYVMCYSGLPLTGTCPQGYVFSDFSLRCQLPNTKEKLRCSRLRLKNMPLTCAWNSKARVASYASCAQYLDCSAASSTPGALPDYVTECPYPQLFSTVTGKCEQYYKVQCTGRTEPKAPCDYVQYKQLCQGPFCGRCEDRHPSCVGRSDGKHLVPPSTTVYLVCHSERTITIGRCSAGQRFSNLTRQCEQITNPSLSLPPSSTFPSSKPSGFPGSTPPKSSNQNSLSSSEIQALFEALKNPVIKQKQTSNVPVPRVSIVSDPTRSMLAIKGAAVVVMSLNKTNLDDQDNGRDGYSAMTSFPYKSTQLGGIMGTIRDELINYGLGISKDVSNKFDSSGFPAQALKNPYSK